VGDPASIGEITETVGVIVPVRGDGPFLSETLEAILAQEPPPADVVVVDDASPKPVALHETALSRCRLVRREVRGGPAGARQTGLEALRTALVALCDSDDVWERGKLAAQLSALEDNPGASVCFGRATVIGPDGAAYQDGSPTVAGTAISVAVRPLGPAGRYTVGYRVVSSDGHPIQGSLGFTLTTAGAASATTGPSASSAPSTAAQPAADTGAGSAAVWPWVLGGVVLVAGGAAVALRQTRR